MILWVLLTNDVVNDDLGVVWTVPKRWIWR